jgi:chromosome segregation ATPase
MDKKQIIFQIGDLIEHECGPCTKLEGETVPGKRQAICAKCPIGIQLKSLGDQLNKPKEVKKLEFTKENYLSLKTKGKTDKEIREIFNVDHNVLYKHKKSWGLVNSYKSQKKDETNWKDKYEKQKKAYEMLLQEMNETERVYQHKLSQLEKEIEEIKLENDDLALEGANLEEQNLKLKAELQELKEAPAATNDTNASSKVEALEKLLKVYLGA